MEKWMILGEMLIPSTSRLIPLGIAKGLANECWWVKYVFNGE
jgi:hypothetical protein